MKKETWGSSSEKANELKLSDFGTPEEVLKMAKMDREADSYKEARNLLIKLLNKQAHFTAIANLEKLFFCAIEIRDT